jgi:hypothetical protein
MPPCSADTVDGHGPSDALWEFFENGEAFSNVASGVAWVSSPQVSSEPVTEVLPVVLRCWGAIGDLATDL